LLVQNCVIHWGNVEAELSSIYWPYALVNGASAVTAAIVHSYLLRRFWLLCVRKLPSQAIDALTMYAGHATFTLQSHLFSPPSWLCVLLSIARLTVPLTLTKRS
jgi:hypothetical protein